MSPVTLEVMWGVGVSSRWCGNSIYEAPTLSAYWIGLTRTQQITSVGEETGARRGN